MDWAILALDGKDAFFHSKERKENELSKERSLTSGLGYSSFFLGLLLASR